MALSDNMRSIIYMNLAVAGFTANDSCMRILLEDLPLFQSLGIRGAFASLFLMVLVVKQGALRARLPRADSWRLSARTMCEVAAAFTFLGSVTHMPFSNLNAISQSAPLVVTLAAAALFGEHLGWRRLGAIIVGFIGVLIVIRPGPSGFDTWSIVALISMFFVVGRDIFTRNMGPGLPSTLVALASTVAVLVVGMGGVAFEGWQPMSWSQIALVIVASLLLCVGHVFMVATVRIGDIGLVAPFRYVGLIWAIVLGLVLFGEVPDGLTLVGSALIVGSGVFMLLRERQLSRRAAARLARHGAASELATCHAAAGHAALGQAALTQGAASRS